MNDSRLYLLHIQESIDAIFDYTAAGREAFMLSGQTQAAVKYTLQTLAESTQHLPEEWKSAHPQIDWPGIAGLRNRLVHDYLGIDPEILWDILQRDLPPLREAVKHLLFSSSNLSEDSSS